MIDYIVKYFIIVDSGGNRGEASFLTWRVPERKLSCVNYLIVLGTVKNFFMKNTLAINTS
jgi:hypothetical protein